MSESKPLPLSREERRAKREARRAKQREANVGRAAKMHVARLAWEREAGPRIMAAGTTSASQLHVGCSGWFYWHWRGGFYPAELPTNRWFEYFSRHFQTVELNAPFYSWPTTAAVQAWVRQAGRRKFIYTVKASELITDVKRFSGTKTLVRDFGHIADLLSSRMGCFLFQLPPSFHYSRARLDRILSQLDPARRNVVEFRHRSWWRARVFTAFRGAGAIFCSCSGPRLPTSWSRLRTTSTSAFMESSIGIVMITRLRNWRYGRSESEPAARSKSGCTSITTAMGMPSRTPAPCCACCGDRPAALARMRVA